MALRGHPSSSTPEKTVEALPEKGHIPIPGEDDAEQNRIAGLGRFPDCLPGSAPAQRSASPRPPADVST